MKTEKSEEWEKLAREVMSGMREWAGQHPKATFAEIERETMRQMAQLQARMMADVAQEMGEEQEKVDCPECGAEMERPKHTEKRQLQAVGGEEVKLERSYAVCPQCGAGFFPPG